MTTKQDARVEAVTQAINEARYNDDKLHDVNDEGRGSQEYARRLAHAALAAADRVTGESANNDDSETDKKLAHVIAQADFIWSLGEQGVMACSPELAGKLFDEAWADSKSSTRERFLHIAQVVRASRAATAPDTTAAVEAAFTADDFHILRQWFNIIQDVNPAYINRSDCEVMDKITAFTPACTIGARRSLTSASAVTQ